jgi:hypothetical protein
MASILRRSRLSGTLFSQFLMLAHGYRSKFLPYGSQYAPTSAAGSAKRADAAFETAALPEAFLSSLKAAREVEIVASTPTATLIRAPEDVIIRLAAACGARAHPLDAGPFASRDAAAELLHRWITEYWECKRLETGGNSCFEFGGCHKRCWWRGAIGQVVLAELHEELQGDEGLESQGPAYSALIDRLAKDRALPQEELGAALRLNGVLISIDGQHHYCGLSPS